MYNDYEWCADGISPQKDYLQEPPLSLIERWITISEGMYHHKGFGARLRSQNQMNMRYCSQSISSLVATPLEG